MSFKVAKEKKGITLIALVITIVVLLILAGVSINLILGDNGIVKKAQGSREKTEEAKANEEKDFAGLTDSIDKILNDNENDDDDDYDNGMAKYFTYTVNEAAKEATITGVKAEYSKYCYYHSDKDGVSAIIDGENEITDIIIPKEINYNGKKYTVTKIGDGMCGIGEGGDGGEFNNLVMPDTITEIGKRAFCKQKIENIVFSANLKKIGDEAFEFNRIANINLPDKLESIGRYAFFSNYEACKEVKIPKSVKIIGKVAFNSVYTIYCEIDQKPDGWNSDWCGYAKVYWNQTL